MAKFTTRVELLDGDSDDYDTLHDEMEARNFTRTITSDTGVAYNLPPAEYNKEGDYTREQVLDSAKNAANVTGKKYRILVTPTTGRIWHNLERNI